MYSRFPTMLPVQAFSYLVPIVTHSHTTVIIPSKDVWKHKQEMLGNQAQHTRPSLGFNNSTLMACLPGLVRLAVGTLAELVKVTCSFLKLTCDLFSVFQKCEEKKSHGLATQHTPNTLAVFGHDSLHCVIFLLLF